MHTRLLGTSILALTLLSAVSAGCRQNTDATTTTTEIGGGVRVSQIDIGRSLNADKTINDNTDSFKPNDVIYASVATAGSAPTATLKVRWTYQDGQVVDEATQTITPTGNARTEFHISKPDGWPAGKYKVEAFLNGASSGTKDFEVKP
jgi:hypothetical protein